MARTALLLAVMLFSAATIAVFSAFAHITPDTQKQFGFEVCVEQGILDTDPVEVSVRAEGPLTGGWLITTSEYVGPEDQEFRQYIWYDTVSESPIESIENLRYDEENGVSRASVPREVFLRSYLYYDFSEPVFDGGYYYSIDLSTFAGFDSDDC